MALKARKKGRIISSESETLKSRGKEKKKKSWLFQEYG